MKGKFYSESTRNVHPRPRVRAIRRREENTEGPRPGLQVTERAREPLRREDQPRIQLKGCSPGADVKSGRRSLSPGTGRYLGCTLLPLKPSRRVRVPALLDGAGALPGNPHNATRGESSLRQKVFALGQFKLAFCRAAASIRATLSPPGGKKPEERYLGFFSKWNLHPNFAYKAGPCFPPPHDDSGRNTRVSRTQH